jgi:hypothetical protein
MGNKSGTEPSGLGALFSKKLSESLLTAADAAALKLKLVGTDKVPTGLPFKAGGFIIPYFDLRGKPTKFWRFRYLQQPERNGFAALAEHKPLRYAQLSGTLNEIYLPPFIDWQSVAADTSKPIIITEGELKAACGSRNTEYPCIGLGGVWCFRSAKQGLPLLPIFNEISWKERQVYIVFDSDAAHKVGVMGAENSLSASLTKIGARVSVARIRAEGNEKWGLDDLLLHKGAEALERTLAAAMPYAPELFALNEEVIYVQDPGLILRFDNMQRLSPRAFVDHAYATRKHYVRHDSEKGSKLEEKSTAKEWLKWPNRGEVRRLCYAPGGERISAANEYNTWTGWGVEPRKGDVSLWKRLLDHLFGDDKPARQWFERWLAYPLQNPGQKMYSSAVLWGRLHGTGKSFVGYSLFKIYGANAIEIKDEHLQKSHNGWAENKQFIMGDEIAGGEAKRDLGNRMKSIITQQKIIIDQKYVPTYELLDCINYYFTSNHPDAFFLEDDDRRMFVWEVLADPLPREFYREYENWIGAPGVIGPGAAALFYHLLHLDLGDFDARGKAPMTAAKADMIANGRSDLGEWVDRLKNRPDDALVYRNERGEMKGIPFALWSSEELLNLYDPEKRSRVTANGMTRELRRAGFRQVCGGQTVPTSWGHRRLWAIRAIAVASRERIGKLYNDERNMPTALPKKKEKHRV